MRKGKKKSKCNKKYFNVFISTCIAICQFDSGFVYPQNILHLWFWEIGLTHTKHYCIIALDQQHTDPINSQRLIYFIIKWVIIVALTIYHLFLFVFEKNEESLFFFLMINIRFQH